MSRFGDSKAKICSWLHLEATLGNCVFHYLTSHTNGSLVNDIYHRIQKRKPWCSPGSALGGAMSRSTRPACLPPVRVSRAGGCAGCWGDRCFCRAGLCSPFPGTPAFWGYSQWPGLSSFTREHSSLAKEPQFKLHPQQSPLHMPHVHVNRMNYLPLHETFSFASGETAWKSTKKDDKLSIWNSISVAKLGHIGDLLPQQCLDFYS